MKMDTLPNDPLKKLQNELEELQERFNRIILDSPLPVMLYADDGEVLLLSHAWVGLSGYTQQEIPTFDHWMNLAFEKDDPHVRHVIRHGKSLDHRDHAGELTIRTKSGQQRVWQFHTSSPGRLPDERRLILTKAIDVTMFRQNREQLLKLTDELEKKVAKRTAALEKKRSQLRMLFSELIHSEQRQRRRLASILHDNLQQQLAAARLQINMAMDGRLSKARKQHLNDALEILDDASGICRDLTVELAPPVLYEQGLDAALAWLAQWFEQKHALKVNLLGDVVIEATSQESAVQIFQSVRELLFNVIKHANTSEARLILQEHRQDYVALTVADDGDGFKPDMMTMKHNLKNGFGLHSVRERIEVLGGVMEVDSLPGEGSRITLIVPGKAFARDAISVA